MGPQPRRDRVLYVIVCAAPPARDAHVLVKLAQQAGWQVCVIATPSACNFIDASALEGLTGYPVRSNYKRPEDPDLLPPPDAIIVAPATFNTINKWAAGISDTLALGLITEGIGKHLPLVAVPFLNTAQAQHPAFTRSVEALRSWGVRVLFGPEVYELHDPGRASERIDLFPWHLALAAVSELAAPQAN